MTGHIWNSQVKQTTNTQTGTENKWTQCNLYDSCHMDIEFGSIDSNVAVSQFRDPLYEITVIHRWNPLL